MHTPHVSVVTPTYLRNDSLFRMIESLEWQTYKGVISVYICHDGPNEELKERIAQYRTPKSNSRLLIQYFEVEHEGLNGGFPRKYLLDGQVPNEGYVVFIDDDNVVYPSFIEHLVNLVENKRIGFCRIEHQRFGKLFPESDFIGKVEFEHIDSLNVIVEASLAKKHSDEWIQNPKEPVNHDFNFIRACFRDTTEEQRAFSPHVLGIHSVTEEHWNSMSQIVRRHPFLYTEIFDWDCYGLTEKDLRDAHVVDIGANTGMFVLYAQRFDPAAIYGYEPVNENFDFLTRQAFKPFVQLHKAAVVSTDNKNKPMFVHGTDVTAMVTDSPLNAAQEVRNKVTLSEIVQAIPSNNIVVKMDCEGGEYDILLNLDKEVLKKIQVITAEVHPPSITGLSSTFTYERIVEFLCVSGYSLDWVVTFFGEKSSSMTENKVLVFRRIKNQKDDEIRIVPKEKPKTVTAYTCTRNRYHTTLPIALNSIIHQEVRPQELIIFDDTPTDQQKDLREFPVYQHLFSLCDRFGIAWRVVFGGGNGQVRGHSHVKRTAVGEYLWRVDDDCYTEPSTLRKLLEVFDDTTGAVAPCIVDPKSVPKSTPNHITGKIQNVQTEENMQWFLYPDDKVLEPEHLYSSFLYRKDLPVEFEARLSPVGHREETLFTHNVFRAGYKLKVRTGALMWHYREPKGGIRSYQDTQMWEHDEHIFMQQMKEWNIEGSTTKYVHLDAGLGDHYAFLNILPELLRQYTTLTIGCCHPELFDGYPNVKLISIQEGKDRFGEAMCDLLNVYRFMIDTQWKGSIVEAYRQLYTGSRIARPTNDLIHTTSTVNGITRQRPEGSALRRGLLEFAKWLGKDTSVVEIGSYAGESTVIFAEHTKHVTAIDSWWIGERVKELFIDATRTYNNIEVIQGNSTDVVHNFPDESLDCVYIDADHEYPNVLADIRAWAPKVRKGGIISGHDYAVSWPGVVRAVQEVLGTPDRVYEDSTWMKVKE